MKWIGITGVAGMLWAAQACAVFTSGQSLHDELVRYNHDLVDFKSITAAGYVIGVADAYDSVAYCIPGNVTKGQVYQIAENYLNANPQYWQKDASGLLLDAFKPLWPCPKK